MKPFLLALSFFTRVPIPTLHYSVEDWNKSVNYYPLVGLVIGGLLMGIHTLTDMWFSSQLTTVLTLVFWIYITGGLHLDGWMDLADGLGSNRERDQMLEIMKDSRVGAMGVLAVLMLLMVKGSALYELQGIKHGMWLILIPVCARTFVLFAIQFWPYVSKAGIGSGMRDGLQGKYLFLAVLLTFILSWLIGGPQALLVVAITAIGGFWLCTHIARKLGGLTGDCYGACIEWCETIALLSIVGTGRWFA